MSPTDLLTLHVFNMCPPTAIIDNAAAVTNVFDSNGFDAILILVNLGATDIAAAVFKLQEADFAASATALTSGTDVPLADFSVSPLTLPSATSDNTIVGIYVPITGARKRFYDLSITGGDGAAGAYFSATLIGLPKNVSNTATERGYGQLAIVAG